MWFHCKDRSWVHFIINRPTTDQAIMPGLFKKFNIYNYLMKASTLFGMAIAQCPSQQFFSHVGFEPLLPGY